ncbi:MAG: tetratricopeptide repeat protein [bacterium]
MEQQTVLARCTIAMGNRMHLRAAAALSAVLISVSIPAGSAAAQVDLGSSDPAAEALVEGQRLLAVPYYERARAAFEKAARLAPDDPEPRVWIGRAYFQEGRKQEDRAIREFGRALEIAPRDREARYWMGRALQRRDESGDMEEAKGYYEGLLEEDPTFRDVLRRVQETHVELGTLPRYTARMEEAARGDTGDALATYRWAEALRQMGQTARAEALLKGLRESARDFLPGRVNYSIAMALFEEERWEEGTAYYLDAIRYMSDPTVAHTMWEDILFIAEPVELQRYRRARSVEEYRDLLTGFWKQRDPDRTDAANERVGVHYRRLKDAWDNYQLPGMRAAWNDPDAQGRLRRPPTYIADAPFDDRGLVYLRWGEPDETAFDQDAGVDNMSWMYTEKGVRPEMIFHFERHELGGGWRFVPYPRPEYAISRTSMDPSFGALQRGTDPQLVDRFSRKANQDILEGLTKDGYIPDFVETYEPLDVFVDWAAFKGSGGRTRQEIYWGIPLISLMNRQVAERLSTEVEVNLSIFSPDFSNEVYKADRTMTIQVPRDTPLNALAVDQEVIPLAAGQYEAALRVEDLVGNKLQVSNFQLVVPDYTGEESLQVSDIQVAMDIAEGETRSRFVKPGYTVVPLPSRVYSRGQPAHIYFGVYGLSKDEVGATRYRVSYTIRPAGGESGTLGRVLVGGLLGRRDEAGGITVTGDEESGIMNDIHKVLQISLGESSYKQYTLRITVEDLVSGRTATSTTYFRVEQGTGGGG